MQFLVHNLLDNASIGFYDLPDHSAALKEEMIYLHGLVVDQNSITIGLQILLIEWNLNDALSRSHHHFRHTIFEKECGDDAIFAEDDVVACHGVEAVL
jgi:hypothetical protein